MKRLFLMASATLALSGHANAQSSITLYGLMDAGVTYTNNVTTSSGHGATTQLSSGVSQGDRWGLMGREDLGGGVHAIFRLESGFQLSNGALASSGTLFGREASVGLEGPLGTVKIGRQYDLIGDTFWAYSIAGNTAAGLLAWGLPAYSAGGGTLDNRLWGDSVNNAVKYLSPSFGGLTIGAMYGFGNVAGSMATDSSMNFMLDYNRGGFHGSLAYFFQHNATTTSNLAEYAAGASYALGGAKVFGVVTDVSLTAGNKARATTYDGGISYFLRPTVSVGAGYQFQTRSNGLASANQMTVGLDYFLSKSTDLYWVAAFAHDHAFGPQIQAALGGMSSTDFQTAMRIGIRHSF